MKHRCTVFALALALALLAFAGLCIAQEPSAPAKPADRVTGTITSTDPSSHTVTVKEDKSGTDIIVDLQSARTLLRVEPTAKDLKNATRITPEDLAVGDRVQVGGTKTPASSNSIVARSVVLMSARELQQVHQAQAAEWQGSTAGVVTAVDTAGSKLTITSRSAEGPKPISVDVSKAQLTRFSSATPKNSVPSQLSDIQPGDQVRVLGDKTADGASLMATKLYSSSFRTIAGSISSIAADGKSVTIKDLQTKQPVVVSLNEDSAVHKLPPMMAVMLARRFNPDFKAPQGDRASSARGGAPSAGSPASNSQGAGPSDRPPSSAPAYGAKSGEALADHSAAPASTDAHSPDGAGRNFGGGEGGPGARSGGSGAYAGRSGGMRNGDLSQMLDGLPKISVTDLKPGDAVVVSGSSSGSDKSHLIGTTIIAGVEPIFQSASPARAQSLGDWGASLGGGNADAGMPQQ